MTSRVFCEGILNPKIGAPGVVRACVTRVHGRQPSLALPDVVYMPPPGSERTSLMCFAPVTAAAIGAPGVVLPSETLVHGRQPCTAFPDVV